jgi:hypothetical protein
VPIRFSIFIIVDTVAAFEQFSLARGDVADKWFALLIHDYAGIRDDDLASVGHRPSWRKIDLTEVIFHAIGRGLARMARSFFLRFFTSVTACDYEERKEEQYWLGEQQKVRGMRELFCDDS